MNKQLTDAQIEAFGIRIHEDGTGFKIYRRYSYNGVGLQLNHSGMRESATKSIIDSIFEAGRAHQAKLINQAIHYKSNY